MFKSLLPLTALAIMCMSDGQASAQSALERLEKKLIEDPKAAPVARAVEEAEPGYLGAITDDEFEQGRGVRVMQVIEGGPAAAAGLEEDDLIVGVDRSVVRRMSDLAQAIEGAPAGRKLTIEIVRGDERRSIEVVLGKRRPRTARRIEGEIAEPGELPPPDEARPAAGRGSLGLSALPVDEASRERLGLESARGALVSEIVVGSPAHNAGIPLGSVIVEVNGSPIEVPDDLGAAIRGLPEGEELQITYLHQGASHEVAVRLEKGVASEDPRDARIQALEQIVLELSKRIERLEAALAKP